MLGIIQFCSYFFVNEKNIWFPYYTQSKVNFFMFASNETPIYNFADFINIHA